MPHLKVCLFEMIWNTQALFFMVICVVIYLIIDDDCEDDEANLISHPTV